MFAHVLTDAKPVTEKTKLPAAVKPRPAVEAVHSAFDGSIIIPVPNPRITSDFGHRSRPNARASSEHKGIDFGTPVGTPVGATASGRVKAVAFNPGGYGKYIMIDHGLDPNGKTVTSLYGHLSEYDVKEGDIVQQGQIIAKSGNTGNSTGPHVHFEVKVNGVAVNPHRLFAETPSPKNPTAPAAPTAPTQKTPAPAETPTTEQPDTSTVVPAAPAESSPDGSTASPDFGSVDPSVFNRSIDAEPAIPDEGSDNQTPPPVAAPEIPVQPIRSFTDIQPEQYSQPIDDGSAEQPKTDTPQQPDKHIEVKKPTEVTIDVVKRMLPNASAEVIDQNYPMLVEALHEQNITDPHLIIYAFATINAESNSFEHVKEKPNHSRMKNYEARCKAVGLPFEAGCQYDILMNPDKARELGNLLPGDGARYCGRGLVQLTGRGNYISYGNALGLDLVNNPDLALIPVNSFRIIALWVYNHRERIMHNLNRGDLSGARAVTNGGTNGLNEFETAYRKGMSLIDVSKN